MADKHLSHEDFFAGLIGLFDARKEKDHGSIFMTQKRLSYNGGPDSKSASGARHEDDTFADLNPSHPLPIIVRATNGKGPKAKDEKVKLSTIVQPDDIEQFFVRYSEVCKTGMRNLKKRDRKARKKDRAKKKKATAEGDAKT